MIFCLFYNGITKNLSGKFSNVIDDDVCYYIVVGVDFFVTAIIKWPI